jgi:uncharacterized C2H2 Zn-finger protein
MEEVEARLDVEVFVDCPKCGYLIDLMNEDDTSGVCHNDEGQVMRQACPDGSWIDEHKKFSIKDVTCSRCDAEFNVKGIEW